MSSNLAARRGRTAFGAIAGLILTLVLAAPAAAAPTDTRVPLAPLGDHVTVCNVSFDAQGNLLLDGSALTVAEAALLDALLAADAGLAAALELAADAAADTCINLDIDLGGGIVTLNADIEVCGAVTADAGAFTVAGADVSADLLIAELENLLEATAAAGVDACVVVTVTDNETVVDAFAAICALATLLDTGVVSVDIGGQEFFLDGTLTDIGGLLEVGVTVEVELTILANLDVASQNVELDIVVAECAAGGGATPTPTPTGSPPGTTPPAGSATPIPGLPDTGAWPVGSNAPVIGLLALLVVSCAVLIGTRLRRSM